MLDSDRGWVPETACEVERQRPEGIHLFYRTMRIVSGTLLSYSMFLADSKEIGIDHGVVNANGIHWFQLKARLLYHNFDGVCRDIDATPAKSTECAVKNERGIRPISQGDVDS
jgi:hypothetical protein